MGGVEKGSWHLELPLALILATSFVSKGVQNLSLKRPLEQGLLSQILCARPVYGVFRKRLYRTGAERMKVLHLSSVVAKDQLPGDYYSSGNLLWLKISWQTSKCGKEGAAPLGGRIFYTALGETIFYFGARFAIASLIIAISRQRYLGKR